MFNLDIYAKAKIGKSLAGFKLGEKLESFLPYIDQTIDENKVQWNVDILANNEGFLLCKWGESYGNGFSIFLRDPKIEFSFSETGVLDFIQVGEGYEGEVFEGGIRIGSRIADIEHNLVLDDIEGAYYLADNEGRFINGIYFLVGGEQVIDNPNATILEVRVYDYSLM